ncbi:tRNA(Ile2) C34 agmatinyltransferase TiaS [Kibdelosporangium phytohabitans]|nr:tRNA(Ile2) C34 agmatinyltransferase TiaS [Kibdelosporangium phytohabitans]
MSARCPSGKRQFRTEEAADAALTSIWSRPWPGGRRLETRYYQCPDCAQWHLTSQPLRPQRIAS